GRGNLFDQVVGSGEVTGSTHQLLVTHGGQGSDVVGDGAHVTDRFDHVPGSCLTLGADHGGTLADPTESFTEVASATYEGGGERPLVDVMLLVGWGEDF